MTTNPFADLYGPHDSEVKIAESWKDGPPEPKNEYVAPDEPEIVVIHATIRTCPLCGEDLPSMGWAMLEPEDCTGCRRPLGPSHVVCLCGAHVWKAMAS